MIQLDTLDKIVTIVAWAFVCLAIALPIIPTIICNVRHKKRSKNEQETLPELKSEKVVIMPYDTLKLKKPFYWARPPIGYKKNTQACEPQNSVPKASQTENTTNYEDSPIKDNDY